MLLRRTGFNRVEIEPLGGMVVNYKGDDTGSGYMLEIDENLCSEATVAG